MSEKKTFKNPYHISHSSDWLQIWQEDNQDLETAQFNEADWDFEITFIKKPKKFLPGDKVNFENEVEAAWYPFGMTVLAQHKGMTVVYDPTDEIEVYDSEILVKI